jgi:son of sevenless-like protein
MDLTNQVEQLRGQRQGLYQAQERAKIKLAEYIYNNNLEIEDLKTKIKFLREYVKNLTTEVTQISKQQIKRSPSGNVVQIDDDSVQFDEVGDLKAGTVSRLIESLYKDIVVQKTSTVEYATVFLLTYRSFTTPAFVLESLEQGYSQLSQMNNPDSLKCRLRIGNFLKKWITENFYDFEDQNELQDKYRSFVQNICKTDSKLGQSLLSGMDTKQKGLQKRKSQAMFSEPAPPSFLPKGDITSIVDIDPREVARQLTLMDYDLCKAIEPKECLGNAWTKEDKEERSPHLLQSIKRFNLVSKWVAYLLVSEPVAKKRVKLLGHILSVLQCLRELNNFNAVFQVVGGLGNSSVHRLTKTFALLKPEKKKILDDLRILTKPEKSWAIYRRTLHEANPPCVPFLGVYQTDLTFIEDGNPSKFASGLINFKKCRLIASVIMELQQYQQKPYNLNQCQPVFDYLQKSQDAANLLDDKKLYELSLIAEPRTQ